MKKRWKTCEIKRSGSYGKEVKIVAKLLQKIELANQEIQKQHKQY